MLRWCFGCRRLIGETDQAGGISSVILMVPSFNLSRVESGTVAGAQPPAVPSADDPLKPADLSSVINLHPDQRKAPTAP